MNILLLAPQPFYQERGTPIAVRMLVETLCEAGNKVDLLTYHVGEDISLAGLKIYRITKLPFIKNIPIGFSWYKLICDTFLISQMMKLIRHNSYLVVHAVEEAIFPGALLKNFFKYKLVYDMDSSIVDQLVEKYHFLRIFRKLLSGTEGWAIGKSDLVVPVCRNLADKVKSYVPENKICILQDVPFETNSNGYEAENLRELLGIDGYLALYVGSLEHYQGIDLMLEGIAEVPSVCRCNLVVIGGEKQQIEKYISKAAKLGLIPKVYFLGSRPLSSLSHYLAQADILVSPRSKGGNTPMKIYSYLSSGKPVLATKINSHTQVMDSSCALLVAPTPAAIAQGFMKLIRDPDLRRGLGEAGKELVKKQYTLRVYKKKLLDSYARVTQAA
jgi:glycosyltransferase involved in cell wall biosynthesis